MKKMFKILWKVFMTYLRICILCHAACGLATACRYCAEHHCDVDKSVDYEINKMLDDFKYYFTNV